MVNVQGDQWYRVVQGGRARRISELKEPEGSRKEGDGRNWSWKHLASQAGCFLTSTEENNVRCPFRGLESDHVGPEVGNLSLGNGKTMKCFRMGWPLNALHGGHSRWLRQWGLEWGAYLCVHWKNISIILRKFPDVNSQPCQRQWLL